MGTTDDLKERWRQANIEYRELIQWYIAEADKIYEKLKAEGARGGLDTDREAFAPLNAEYKRRLLALFDKYDLPNKPKL